MVVLPRGYWPQDDKGAGRSTPEYKAHFDLIHAQMDMQERVRQTYPPRASIPHPLPPISPETEYGKICPYCDYGRRSE